MARLGWPCRVGRDGSTSRCAICRVDGAMEFWVWTACSCRPPPAGLSLPPSPPPPAPRLPGKPPRASRRPGTPPSWGEGLSAPWPAVGFYARAQPRGLRQPRWRRAPRAAPRNPTAATAPAPSAPSALPEPRWAPARRPGPASPGGRCSRTCLQGPRPPCPSA